MADREIESQGSHDTEAHRDASPRSPGSKPAEARARSSFHREEGGGACQRRRKSSQLKNVNEGRKRWLVVVGMGMVLPIVGGVLLWAVAGYFRCESDGFRRALAEHLSRESGFKVHVGPIEVRGLNLSAPNLSLSQGNGAVRYVEFRNLRATVAPKSFFGGDWRILDLRIDQAEVHFSSADEESESVAAQRDTSRIGWRAAGFGLNTNPGNWSVEAIQVHSLNLFWSESDGKDTWVRDCRLTAGNFSADRKVRLSGGAAAVWGYPPFRLDHAELQFREKDLEIVKAYLREDDSARPGGSGTVEMSGFAGWTGEQGVALAMQIQEFSLEGLASGRWKKRIEGRISAKLGFDGRLSAGGGGLTRGSFQISEGRIKGLPLLDALAEVLRDSRYRHLALGDKFGGTVSLSRGGVSLKDLEIENAGLMKISGALGWRAAGAVSGELEVGLPAATLDQFPGGKPRFFGTAEEGYCMARLVASGELASPRESLTEALLAAGVSAEGLESPVNKSAKVGSDLKSDLLELKGESEKARAEELFRGLLE